MPDEQRRYAERIDLSEPIDATLADLPARIIQISLINCCVEHSGKVPIGSMVTLQFAWRGENLRLKGKIARTEMRSTDGRLLFLSFVQFSTSLEDGAPLLWVLRTLLEKSGMQSAEPTPQAVEPAQSAPVELVQPEAEILVPPYVECTLVEGKWVTRRVSDPKQPGEGFTMLAPDTDDELDEYCRTYEVAESVTRRLIRLSFEIAIAQRGSR